MLRTAPIARIATIVASIVASAWLAACSRPASSPSAGPVDPPVAADAVSGDAKPGPPGDPLCDVAECGPPIRMPSRRCSDGSIGGPTGRCLRKPDGRCAWEVRPCPPG